MEKTRILIVEDDPDFQTLIGKHLETFGYEVLSAFNGEEALKKLDAQGVRIMLTDLSMPKMSGMDLIKTIRQRVDASYVYIIVISALADIKDIVQGLDVGADDYISKPLSFVELQARIKIGERIVDLESRLKNSIEVQVKVAQSDYLTGLYNRRHIFELGQHIFGQGKRYGRSLSVSMIDIDRFKAVNDTYGHAVGDEALIEVSKRFLHIVRDVDLVGRLGGEEFVVLMPETGGRGALKVTERLRKSVNERPIRTSGPALQLTISQGVATQSSTTHDLDSLIKKADAALYGAKADGRNQVRFSP